MLFNICFFITPEHREIKNITIEKTIIKLFMPAGPIAIGNLASPLERRLTEE